MQTTISITRASKADTNLVAELGKTTFQQSHGHSASAEDIESYISKTYTEEAIYSELVNDKNYYYIIYHNKIAAGYSKVIFDAPYKGAAKRNITKLERLYLLEEYYGLGLASRLWQFNIELLKANKQAGAWLFVWKENDKAIRFYSKNGFQIIGEHDFPISKNHSNPNYQMLLLF